VKDRFKYFSFISINMDKKVLLIGAGLLALYFFTKKTTSTTQTQTTNSQSQPSVSFEQSSPEMIITTYTLSNSNLPTYQTETLVSTAPTSTTTSTTSTQTVLGVDTPLITGQDIINSAPTTPTTSTTSSQPIITFPSTSTYYFEAASNLLKWFSYIPDYLKDALNRYPTAQIILDPNPTAKEVQSIPTNSIYIYKANTTTGFNYLVPEDIAWAKTTTLSDVSKSFGIPQ
jgi:hypothetical protein